MLLSRKLHCHGEGGFVENFFRRLRKCKDVPKIFPRIVAISKLITDVKHFLLFSCQVRKRRLAALDAQVKKHCYRKR